MPTPKVARLITDSELLRSVGVEHELSHQLRWCFANVGESMPLAVQVVHGDMFSGPADLIVMPRSVGGSVTWFVRQRMQQFELPRTGADTPRMRCGCSR